MKVGYFVPCYIDALAPQAAKSTYNLLKRFDLDVVFIEQAACCALPLTDMGYEKKACKLEDNLYPLLKGYDAIVIPSGICTEQIRDHFAADVSNEENMKIRNSVYDIVEFLHDVLKVKSLPWAHFPHKVALHNGCHSLRYLKHARPTELMEPDFSKTEDLLKLVDGIEVTYATRKDECCGFGGTFSMWDVSCSGQMGKDKVHDYANNGIQYVTSADYSCLLHQQSIANKLGLDIKTYYISEILNGDV
ncbi:MAG: (Fe-S)-binding protein [Bacteroidales bacterium]